MSRSIRAPILRRALDTTFAQLRTVTEPWNEPPKAGWLRAIREALGITLTQMGHKMGVAPKNVQQAERGEEHGTITLARLRQAAAALDCEVRYILVPRRPLHDMVAERAHAKAKRMLADVAASMALEQQSVGPVEHTQQLNDLAEQLVKAGGSRIWDDDP